MGKEQLKPYYGFLLIMRTVVFDAIAENLRENTVIWLMVMFVGVLYWGFRARWRNRRNREENR